MPYQPLLRRPGGRYGVVLSMIGMVELAVTTDLAVHFLRRPPPEDVIADGRLLKLGRRRLDI